MDLQDYIIVEQITIVGFIGQRVKPAEIHHRMLVQYGSENSMAQWKVYEWIGRFKSGKKCNYQSPFNRACIDHRRLMNYIWISGLHYIAFGHHIFSPHCHRFTSDDEVRRKQCRPGFRSSQKPQLKSLRNHISGPWQSVHVDISRNKTPR